MLIILSQQSWRCHALMMGCVCRAMVPVLNAEAKAQQQEKEVPEGSGEAEVAAETSIAVFLANE